MCNIAGYITYKKSSKEIKKKIIPLLLAGTIRGTDATGIGFIDDQGFVEALKAPVPAWKFTKEKVFNNILKNETLDLVILHNRAKTQGDASNNKNNHPIFSKAGFVMIHNGILWNDKEVIKDLKLNVDGKVDSEVILRTFEHYYSRQKKPDMVKAIQKTTEKIRGSLTMALINQKQPDRIYLTCSTTPLWLAYHIPTRTTFFGSTEDILKQALIGKELHSGFFSKEKENKDYILKEIDDDSGLIIKKNEVLEFDIERPSYYNNSSDHSSFNNNSSNVSKNWNDNSDYEQPRYGKFPFGKKSKKKTRNQLKLLKLKARISKGNIKSPVIRPSLYSDLFLIQRLKLLKETFENYAFLTNKDYLKTDNEYRRIINALSDRKYQLPAEIKEKPEDYYDTKDRKNKAIISLN